MNLNRGLIAATLIVAPAVMAQAQTAAKTYVMKAGAGDLYEKQSSKLELQSTNPKVRDFAQMMITDHTKSTADVKAAAMSAKMSPAPPKLNAEQARNVAALKAAKGTKRDQLYIAQQKVAHQQALALHSGYAQSGSVPSLKTAATNIAPVVQHHIDMLAAM